LNTAAAAAGSTAAALGAAVTLQRRKQRKVEAAATEADEVRSAAPQDPAAGNMVPTPEAAPEPPGKTESEREGTGAK
jgi:hypothetical protein